MKIENIKSNIMLRDILIYSRLAIVTLAASSLVTACNKIPGVEDLPSNPHTAQTIGDIISSDSKYSILKEAVTKAGVMPVLSNPANKLTVFAPDNDAMALSGISSAVIAALPADRVAAVVNYHIIAQELKPNSITTDFPNVQMPSMVGFPPPAPAIIKLSVFPSRRASQVFVNNIPINRPEVQAANGVIYNTFAVVAPPPRVLMDTIARDPDLSFFAAAIARGDKALPAGSKFSEILANPLSNWTVFAPNNDAFKAILTLLGAPPVPQAIAALDSSVVAGIVAYHIHIKDMKIVDGAPNISFSRAFSVNLPATEGSFNTFLKVLLYPNPAPPIFLDQVKGVKGYINPTYSNIVGKDRNAVNGVLQVIDQVLLPRTLN